MTSEDLHTLVSERDEARARADEAIALLRDRVERTLEMNVAEWEEHCRRVRAFLATNVHKHKGETR